MRSRYVALRHKTWARRYPASNHARAGRYSELISPSATEWYRLQNANSAAQHTRKSGNLG